ncbi:MAG: tetratricopeptide repeat protein, partial [Alphaproteobacteria bacterium]
MFAFRWFTCPILALVFLSFPVNAQNTQSCLLGLDAANAERYLEARDQLTTCIDQAGLQGSNLALVYRVRGVTYGELDQDELALNDLNRAVQSDPEYAEAYYSRGLL